MSRRRVACIWVEPSMSLLAVRDAEPLFFALAESLGRFSPVIALRGREAIFLEIGKSHHLFPEASFPLRVQALGRRLGLPVLRVAVADTAPLALVAARYEIRCRFPEWSDLGLETFSDLLAPFDSQPDPELARKIIAWRASFEDLGVRSLGEFAELPKKTLASRMGAWGLELMGRIWGDREPAWPRFEPPEKLVERMDFSDLEIAAEGVWEEKLKLTESDRRKNEGDALGPAVFVIKALMDRALLRLRGRAQRASRVALRLRVEGWEHVSDRDLERTWEWSLAFPQSTSAGLLPVIRERVARELERRPLGAPIREIEFEVLEMTPGSQVQRNWITDHDEERAEHWQAVLGRLSAQLGKDEQGQERIFQWKLADRYRPERQSERTTHRSRSVVQEESAILTRRPLELRPRRPALLLRQPLRLELAAGGSAALRVVGADWVSEHGQRFKITHWEGPERMSSEWWEPEPLRRAYYEAWTQQGQRLWVFWGRGEAQAAGLFLHGYFD